MLGDPHELIQVQDRYYILASSSRVDDRTRVLKHGETFAVFDRFGDIAPVGFGELGLYHEGTRFLSRLGLSFGPDRPLLLSSTVTEDNARLVVDLTNPDITVDGEPAIPRGILHLARETVLWQGVCYERLRIANYGDVAVAVPLTLTIDSDFADIFEVRGTKREQRGRVLDAKRTPSGLALGYHGRDGVGRTMRLACTPAPDAVDGGIVRFDVRLAPRQELELVLAFSCEIDGARPILEVYDEVVRNAEGATRVAHAEDCGIRTSNDHFNEWLDRSLGDLHMMTTQTEHGPYPFAGVPWFNTPFGRDGLITALQMLWIDPSIARGVLTYLAATQADRSDEEHDAQPGKILHEARKGEMSALGEVPFARYYGSVDATPLFVMLTGAYLTRTGDRAFVSTLWPHVERALAWIDGEGDPDRDGFVEYARRSPHGLVQQGWKDSHDAIFHADGTPAEPPIALCEVQAYVYGARRAAAAVARKLDLAVEAEALDLRASELRDRFERAFWCDDLETYALALDGAKRPCRLRTSNAGHCLFTGIAAPERARRVMRSLVGSDSWSGWGIRTLAAGQARYNPMSYHNGSVWPHDNSIVGAGFARYDLKDAALELLNGMFDASQFTELHRLPELFCGFPRRAGEGPTLYPVACSPQAWAAGAAFMLLEACLGLTIDAAERRVCFRRAVLPDSLREVRIASLRVGDGSVDLELQRHREDVGVNVVRRSGEIEVVTVK